MYLIALLALVAGGWYYFDQRFRPVLVAGPMIQLRGSTSGNSNNSISIVWRAAESGKPDHDLTRGEVEFSAEKGLPTPRSADDSAHRYCRERVDGLRPDATLQFAIANRGFLGRKVRLGDWHSVQTPPTPEKSFRFLAFGDSGNGSNTQRLVAERMIATKPDLVIHLGDLIYPAGAADDYKRNFFEPYRELLARVPFMPTLGNHDVATDKGQPFLDVFDLPQNGPEGIQPERNFYFDFGCARFVGLDSNRESREEHGAITEQEMREVVAPWLRGVLCGSKARWKFVYFHHPPYTGSTHPASAQKFVHDIFVPIFEECGVDVVFSGHNHLYERTKPIRGDRIVPPGQGVVYIVSGAAGVSRYPEDKDPPDYIEKFNSDIFSFTQVDLSPAQFHLSQIGESGKVIDQLTIDKPISPKS